MQLADILQQDEKVMGISPYPVWGIWLIWLPFLTQSVVALIQMPPSLQKTGTAAGTLLFVGSYLCATWQEAYRLTRAPQTPARSQWKWWVPIALLIGLSVTMPFVQSAWGLGGFIYTSASVAGRLKLRLAVPLFGGLLLLTAILGVLTAVLWSTITFTLFIVLAVGATVATFSNAIHTNWELRLARREIARLAVAEERLRFARDLHDLLGHTLSLITIKSELAGQLIIEDPLRAQSEVYDIEAAARTALQEVREAVAGYRQSTLADELQGAHDLLTAAGIHCTIQNETDPLPATSEALLTWVVREGITNVIRHSRAKQCVVSLTHGSDRVCLAVTDDGHGNPEGRGIEVSGNGLRGIAERVAALEGSFETGTLSEGGFRLSVCLPARSEHNRGR